MVNLNKFHHWTSTEAPFPHVFQGCIPVSRSKFWIRTAASGSSGNRFDNDHLAHFTWPQKASSGAGLLDLQLAGSVHLNKNDQQLQTQYAIQQYAMLECREVNESWVWRRWRRAFFFSGSNNIIVIRINVTHSHSDHYWELIANSAL